MDERKTSLRRPLLKRSRALTVGVALLALVALASPAMAHGFGNSATPTHTIADSSYHTWATYETRSTYKNLMESVFDGRMTGQIRDRTDMSAGKITYDSTVDAYWFATPVTGGVADATCMVRDYGANPKCYRTRIRFEESYLNSASLNSRKQAACHEIGHSIGFDDSQPETNTGCMSGGLNGTLSTHEINHINAQW